MGEMATPFPFPSVGNHSFQLSCQRKSSRRQEVSCSGCELLLYLLVPRTMNWKIHAFILNLGGGSSWNKLSGKREKCKRGTGMKMALSYFFRHESSVYHGNFIDNCTLSDRKIMCFLLRCFSLTIFLRPWQTWQCLIVDLPTELVNEQAFG